MRIWRKEKSIIYSLHDERIPARGANFSYTFGLGGIAVLATIITVLTGLALTFYYIPIPERARDSIVLINDVASFGAIVRGLHYWAAQLMVIAVTLHLARVVFTGGYRPPRELNWLLGLSLLVITLLWDFTGFVLRWDDAGISALTVGTNLFREIPFVGDSLFSTLVGDAQLGGAALLRFYGWHVVGLTLIGVMGIVYHLWRLRKDGGISCPLPQNGDERPTISRDELFVREFVVAAFVTAALILVSLVFTVPIGPVASPSAQALVVAPWIFLWVQNLLRDFPPLWAGILAPIFVLLALAAIPLIDRHGPGRAVWFARERWKPQALLLVLAVGIVLLSLREVFQ